MTKALRTKWFLHFREQYPGCLTNPRGGATVCLLPVGEGGYKIGLAIVSPQDAYDRKYGRNKSQGLARSRNALFLEGMASLEELIPRVTQMVELAEIGAAQTHNRRPRWLVLSVKNSRHKSSSLAVE